MKRVVLVWLCLLVPGAAQAAEVVIKNGDRLTGEVIRLEKKTLELKSEYAGDLKIDWSAVAELRSSQPLHVTTPSGTVLAGAITLQADTLQITTALDTTPRTLSRDAVLAIRSEKEHEKFVKSQLPPPRPGLLDNWYGSAKLGLSAARGNTDTTTLTATVNAARITSRDRASFYVAQLLGRESTTGVTITTANTLRGGLRYDRLISAKRLFGFGFADFEHDELQQLNLRSVYGGGLGLALSRSDRRRLDVFAGASFNQEDFTVDPTRRSGEALAGEEFAYKLNSKLTFNERLIFYSNLTEVGEYRITFDSSLGGKLNSWLGWHLTLSDRYISNPAAGARRNDLLLTTGLRFTFGQEREFSIDSRAPELIKRR